MLKRKIEKDIADWYKYSKAALMIEGARQTGKTFIIRSFLENNKIDYVELNLLNNPAIAKAFLKSSSLDSLINRLELLSPKKFIPGKTLIFLDEIQECPDIVTQIKFLVDDGRFRYILSGSLLGREITNLLSAPVGYMRILDMYPLDFEEFLQIYSVPQSVLAELEGNFRSKTPVDGFYHDQLTEFFKFYMVIGGMPAAVQKYADTKSMSEVEQAHNEIIEIYRKDFSKYESEKSRLYLNAVYNRIPAELNAKNKRFCVSSPDITSYAHAKSPARMSRMENSFLYLTDAGVAIAVYNVDEPMIPLLSGKGSTLFKLFLSDVGLLATMYGRDTKSKILSASPDVNMGGIYENFVAQELRAHGYKDNYYYNSKILGELDFVIEYNGQILPLEVKSGKSYERHLALNNVMNVSNYDIQEAYVLSGQNVSQKGNITYLPIYMTMFIYKNFKPDVAPPGPFKLK